MLEMLLLSARAPLPRPHPPPAAAPPVPPAQHSARNPVDRICPGLPPRSAVQTYPELAPPGDLRRRSGTAPPGATRGSRLGPRPKHEPEPEPPALLAAGGRGPSPGDPATEFQFGLHSLVILFLPSPLGGGGGTLASSPSPEGISDHPSMSRQHSSPLEDEDLLGEILLRLPPQPSSLPRASLVCPRWRSAVSDPRFRRRFREHHRKPPLLGFFARHDREDSVFTPLLDPPDRIPAERFAVPLSRSEGWYFVGCRHGLAVLINQPRRETVVWDPLTGQQRHMPFPEGFDGYPKWLFWHSTVLCVDTQDGHVHGDCFSSPFKLVLICAWCTHAFGLVYDSASGVWGNVVSILCTDLMSSKPGVIIGSVVYWVLNGGDVLAFDTETQSLSIIEKPTDVQASCSMYLQPLRIDDSALGLAVIPMSKQNIQLWARKSNSDGVFSWVLRKMVQLNQLFPRPPHVETLLYIQGYDEDTNVIFLASDSDDFMLQLETMQFTHIGIGNPRSLRMWCYPYTNFYTTVRGVAGGDGGAEHVNT